ncbi:MAG: aminotransferase class I/II-fold pyridoxal phosphate-dependent enzyme [Planctomycetes bacterium]|nr:aminotransferase class I/II-fold pyridoxal phosphate-dependent enzyme [Planctomycetota bacterium]
MTLPLIDMRSDTVTKPTAEMRQAMARAEVGDDMSGEDPTVNRLEAVMAELLGKEAAVFACSGTQSNQMGVRTHCLPGDELLIEATSHIVNYEQGGPAALSGVTGRLITGQNGLLDIADLEGKIRADNQHLCITRLVCLENTSNVGGGRAYPLEQIHRVGKWAHQHGLLVHLDGARLFNAVIATGASAAEICRHVDTVSVCFSKGLGCPMGSLLAGSKAQIAKARRARKLFGGALRQAGIVAAAALYAIENHIERLHVDHDNAKEFANAIYGIDGITVEPGEVETNLVFFNVDPSLGTAAQLSAQLFERGVRINASAPQRLRACTHLDVDRGMVLRAADAVAECVSAGFATTNGAEFGPYSRG